MAQLSPNRRQLAQGVAWATPAIIMTTAAPAFAASNCGMPTMQPYDPAPFVFDAGATPNSSPNGWTLKRPISGELNAASGANNLIDTTATAGTPTGALRLFSSEMDSTGTAPYAVSSLTVNPKTSTGEPFQFQPGCSYTFTFYTYANFGNMDSARSIAQAFNFFVQEMTSVAP